MGGFRGSGDGRGATVDSRYRRVFPFGCRAGRSVLFTVVVFDPSVLHPSFGSNSAFKDVKVSLLMYRCIDLSLWPHLLGKFSSRNVWLVSFARP